MSKSLFTCFTVIACVSVQHSTFRLIMYFLPSPLMFIVRWVYSTQWSISFSWIWVLSLNREIGTTHLGKGTSFRHTGYVHITCVLNSPICGHPETEKSGQKNRTDRFYLVDSSPFRTPWPSGWISNSAALHTTMCQDWECESAIEVYFIITAWCKLGYKYTPVALPPITVSCKNPLLEIMITGETPLVFSITRMRVPTHRLRFISFICTSFWSKL